MLDREGVQTPGRNAIVSELAALFCHANQVWRAVNRRAKRLDVTVAQVVAKDDDEIGFVRHFSSAKNRPLHATCGNHDDQWEEFLVHFFVRSFLGRMTSV